MSVTAAPDLVAFHTKLAPWAESRVDRCRGGRTLVTVVSHRDGRAVQFAPADLDPAAPAFHRTMADLAAAGALVDSPPGDTTSKRRGDGIAWRHADAAVRRAHALGLRHLFRRGALLIQGVLALAGAVAVVATFRQGDVNLRAHPAQIPWIILLGLVAVTIHELGHALVTVHFGRSVRSAGVRLHLGSPTFYVESVDALLLDRRQRLLQAAAGPWAEWLTMSVVAIVAYALPSHGFVAVLLHRFIVVNTFVVLSNLLPFVGLDGALLLGDAIGEPDLAARAGDPASTGGRWFHGYRAANALVAAALLVASGFFWWELFAGVIASLWALGPLGIVALASIGLLLTRPLVEVIGAQGRPIVWHAQRAWRRLHFRCQRRWRVRSISAMRRLPSLARLDAQALGILAGRLERRGTATVLAREGARAFATPPGAPAAAPGG